LGEFASVFALASVLLGSRWGVEDFANTPLGRVSAMGRSGGDGDEVAGPTTLLVVR
jgi:hypothetical protein